MSRHYAAARGADTRKARLAALVAASAAFPGITFTWEDARRRPQDGARLLVWTGGPPAADVRAALLAASCLPPWRDDLHRRMTEAEAKAWQAEQDARYERERAEREASEPARRAAAKAAGIAAAAATRARRKAGEAALAAAFPDVAFTWQRTRWGAPAVEWTDGPAETAVRAALPRVDCPWLDRRESPAERARIAAEAERLRCQADAEAVAAAQAAAELRAAARRRRIARLCALPRQLELIPCPGDCRPDPGPLPEPFEEYEYADDC